MNKDFLQVGNVINLKDGMKIYGYIPEKHVYSNRPNSDELCETEIVIGGEKDIYNFKGDYVVIRTKMCGGGYGHGIHDVYPDGWFVECKKLKNEKFDTNGLEISFYQSGCFTAMIRYIKPHRKMIMVFK